MSFSKKIHISLFLLSLMGAAPISQAITCKQAVNVTQQKPASFKKGDMDTAIVLFSFLSQQGYESPLDVVPRNMDPALGEVRKIIIKTQPEEFDAIFSHLDLKTLNKINKAVQNKELKSTKAQQERIKALTEFANNDPSNSLFQKGGSPWSRLYTNYPEFQGPAHKDNVGGMIARTSTSTLTDLEIDLRRVAEGESQRLSRGNFFDRLLMHPRTAFKLIINFNNQIRERLEHVEGVQKALKREKADEIQNVGVKLTNAEIKRIKNLNQQLEQQLKKTRADIETAYGQDITTGGYQAIGLGGKQGDLYRIVKNIKGKNKEDKKSKELLQSEVRGEFILTSESVLNEFNNLLNQARKRQNLPERTEEDMDKVELQIHNHQYRRRYQDEMAKWKDVMSRGTGKYVKIYYSWTEMEPREGTRSDGNGGTETYTYYEQVTKSDSALEEVTFYDVIVDNIDRYSFGRSYSVGSIDSVYGKSEILAEASKIIEAERPFAEVRFLMDSLVTLMGKNSSILSQKASKPKLYKKHLAKVQKIHEELLQAIARFLEHKNNYAQLWEVDSAKYFKQRHEQYLVALKMLKEFNETYKEQFKDGEYELTITPDVQEHNMKKLNRMYLISMLGRSTTGVATACAATLLAGEDSDMNCINLIWDSMKDITEGMQ